MQQLAMMPTISGLLVQHNSAAQQTIKASHLYNSMNYAAALMQAATVPAYTHLSETADLAADPNKLFCSVYKCVYRYWVPSHKVLK
jgi:hypothetical protein